MKELKSKAGELSDSITDYIHTYYKLSVLKATDKATGIGASLVSSLTIAFLGVFVLLFAGFALGIWFGSLLHNAALGFLLVAAVYLVIIVVVVLLRKKIVFPIVRNLLINKLYE